MFDYVTSIKSRARECTPALFQKIIDSKQVADICAEIADAREKCLRGEMSREDYDTFKSERKKALPGFNFQAHYKGDGRRLDKNAVPSGLCIYDKDHVPDPRGWCLSLADSGTRNAEGEERNAESETQNADSEEARRKAFVAFCKRMGIVLAHVTPSGEGARLVFRVPKGLSLADAQASLAQALGDDDYDGSVKDLARVSFAVPRDYLLYLDATALFQPTPDGYQLPFPVVKSEQRSTLSSAAEQPASLSSAAEQPASLSSAAEQPASLSSAAVRRQAGGLNKATTSQPVNPWRCKKPTLRTMAIIQTAMRKRGITKQALEQKGQRHYMFVNLLSTGICRLLTKEELMGGLKKVTRIANTDNIWRLVADWYKNYLNADKPVSENFAWTFADVLNKPEEAEEKEPDDLPKEEPQAEAEKDFAMPIDDLPIGLRESLQHLPDNLRMPVACAIMPLAGAYADQVEVRYADGRQQHLGLMSIIVGEQASKKSTCKDIVDVWKQTMHDEDMAQRRIEDDWKQRRKNRKANEKGEPDPCVLIREIPVTVSCSTLLKRFKNSREHCLYSFGEELDTLRKTNGAGSWSSKYDIYRLAFDRGEWGQDYNSDQAESGIVNVAYNWTILGTYGALRKCFRADNIENGLSSRMMVAEMPDNRFAPMTTFSNLTSEDHERIHQAVEQLRAASGFIDTPRLREAMAEWVEQKRIEALKAVDEVMDTYRKRAAVIGFRCGVIFALLAGAETDASLAFARMMADYVLREQCKLFGEGLTSEQDASAQRNSPSQNIFAKLPNEFTMDNLRNLSGAGRNDNANYMTIYRWKRNGLIEKVERGKWRKVGSEKPNNLTT